MNNHIDKQLFQLAPYVRVGITQDTLFLGFGSMQLVVKENHLFKDILSLLAELRQKPQDLDYIYQQAASRNLLELFKQLHAKRFFMATGLYDRDDRYSRNLLYFAMQQPEPLEVQDAISNKHVVILGAGGIGNMIAPQLVGGGIKKLTLVDGDTIELSNLTRQYLFTEKDVGYKKIDILARELRKRNNNTIIETLDLEITTCQDATQLPQADLIVLSADSENVVDIVNKYCIKTKTPFINVCYIQDIAAWGPLVIPGESGCWDCQNNLANSTSHEDKVISRLLKEANAVYQAPSFGPINMLASSLAGIDVMRFLGNYGHPAALNKRIGLWTHNLQFEEQDFARNPLCPTCSSL